MEAFKLPLIPFRSPQGKALFPGLSYSMKVGRPGSLAAIKVASQNGNRALIAFQKNPATNTPKFDDLYDAVVEATITKTSPVSGGINLYLSILRRGILRSAKIGTDSLMMGVAEFAPEIEFELTDGMIKTAMELQGTALNLSKTQAFKPHARPRESKEFVFLIDALASAIELKLEERIWLVKSLDPLKRLEQLRVIIARLEAEEGERIAEEEKRKAEEAKKPRKSTKTAAKDEISRLAEAIVESGMPNEARKMAEEELEQLRVTPPQSSEYATQRNHLNMLVELPWISSSDDRLDIPEAEKILDEDHYGLEEPKERILEFLSIRKLAPEEQGGMILCLSGPPGVGKTSLGRSIARATGREFVRLSLGGVRDEAEIRGHRRTYIGAMPGRIIQEIKRLGVHNPVFMLDEVDKLGNDFRGDPSDALLEVLDPEQNHSFRDNYVGTGFDLSKVMFIVTANDPSRIHPPLYDRMEVVEIPGYSSFDKMRIAKRHLVDKQKKKNGLADAEVVFGDDAFACIIESYTRESGVRELERRIGGVLRKLAKTVASGDIPPEQIDASMVRKLLKHPKIHPDKRLKKPTCGVSTGLAWTPYGGSVLLVETLKVPGADGKVAMTGKLGDVLKESVETAMAWIKAHADEFGIADIIKSTGLHVHLPAGAVPKDGPSAGIAISTALVSALTGQLVRHDIAMTGEISLQGDVLPIGGVVAKVLAARRNGIKEVILPADNKHMTDDIPKEVADEMTFRFVEHVSEVFDLAFASADGDENIKQSSGEFNQIDLEAKHG